MALKKKYELFIHTLNIECQPWQQGEKDLAEDDPLAEYYLDLSQLSSTSETDVESMLNDFWERMGQDFSTKQRMPTDEACEVMELTPPLTEKQVKSSIVAWYINTTPIKAVVLLRCRMFKSVPRYFSQP